jgi:hypothetical protein
MPFCTNCGAETEGDGKFCLSCGCNLISSATQGSNTDEAQVRPVQQDGEQTLPVGDSDTRPETAGYDQAERRGGKRKNVFFLIAALVLVLGGSSIFAYTFLLKKSPRQLLFEAELKNYRQVAAKWETGLGEMWELQKMVATKPSSSTTELSADFSVSGLTGNEYAQMESIRDILSKSSLIFKTDNDPQAARNLTTFSVLLSGAVLADAQLFHTQTQTGIKVPLLHDKFFYVDNHRLGDAMRRFDPYYSGPEEIVSSNRFTRSLQISDQTKREIQQRYLEYLAASIKEENVALDENVNYSSPDGDKRLRKLTLSMTEQEVSTFFTGLLQKLQADDQLLDVVSESVAGWVEAANMVEPYTYGSEWGSSSVKEMLKEALTEMQTSLSELGFPGGLTMSLMLDDKGEIVDRQISFHAADLEGDGGKVNFSSMNWPHSQDGPTRSWQFEFLPDLYPEDKAVVAGRSQERQEAGGTREDVNLSFTLMHGEESNTIQLDIGVLKKEIDQKIHEDFDFNLSFGDSFYSDLSKISGTVNRVTDQNLKKNYYNQTLDVMVTVALDHYYTGRQDIDVFLKVSNDIQFREELDIPDLNSNSAVDLASVSDRELEQIYYDIENAITAFFWQNQSLLEL